MPNVFIYEMTNASRKPRAMWMAKEISLYGYIDRGVTADMSQAAKGDIVVFADNYSDIEPKLDGRFDGMTKLLLTSQISPEQAEDAAAKGVITFLSESRTTGLEPFIEEGLILPVSDAPSAPQYGSLDALAKIDHKTHAQLESVFANNAHISVIYPCGYYTRDNALEGKEKLQDDDMFCLAKVIRMATKPAIVVCGGRLNEKNVMGIKAFAGEGVTVISQNNHAYTDHDVDVFSAVIEGLERYDRKGDFYIDAIAGTTWATLRGSDLNPTVKDAIIVPNMLRSAKRLNQAMETAAEYANNNLSYHGDLEAFNEALKDVPAHKPTTPGAMPMKATVRQVMLGLRDHEPKRWGWKLKRT